MKDLIDRQAAIDALGEKPLAWTEGEYELGLQNQWQSDVDALNGLPSAQPEPHWIPCGERLPEVGKDVMVCYDFKGHRSVLIGVLYGDEKFHGYDDEYLTPEGRKYRKAVAWMPLPEQYEERQDE